MKFVGICGSLRAASTNGALLRAMAIHAPPGVELSIHESLGLLPIFNPDDEDRPAPAVSALVEAVTRADGVIVASPEYAHGVPGGLKNALDWLVATAAPVGKPAMQVHASPRSLFAREALAETLRTMSFDLFDDAMLELPLIGRKPDELAGVLARAETIAAMGATLSAFADFVRRRNMAPGQAIQSIQRP